MKKDKLIENLIRLGGTLSNMAYNLKGCDRISPLWKEQLNDIQEEWDKAYKAYIRAKIIKAKMKSEIKPKQKNENQLTTKKDINNWIKEGKKAKATHLIVVLDSYDYEYYPVFVKSKQELLFEYNSRNRNMQKVMEVYDLKTAKVVKV